MWSEGYTMADEVSWLWSAYMMEAPVRSLDGVLSGLSLLVGEKFEIKVVMSH